MTYGLVAEPSRTLYATCASLIDAVFTDGYGDPMYATQTKGATTELMRVDPPTKTLYPVAVISWPQRSGQQPTVTALDLKKQPPGTVPKIRHIVPSDHVSLWFHTTITLRKNVYERYATHVQSGHLRRSTISRRTRGMLSWREVACEIRLFPDGYLRDDVDAVLSSLLLLCRPHEWRTRQSGLSRIQLESCLAVTQLRMDSKWEEPQNEVEDVLV